MIRKIIFLLAFSLIAIPYNTSAMIDLNRYSQKLYKPVAMVENRIITEKQLEQKIAILRMTGIDLTREEALANLINQEAILYKNRDFPISQDAINFTIKRFAVNNGISDGEFNKLLNKFGIERQYLIDHVAAQMLLNEMVMGALKKMPESQSSMYYKAHSTTKEIEQADKIFLEPKIEYTFNNKSQVKIAEMIVRQGKHLQSIIEALKEGESFSKIKSRFPNEIELSTQDGTIGWLNFNEMSELYQQVISNTKINNIAEPLVSNNNFLFIKLLDIKDVAQSKKFINPHYVNLTAKQKAEQLYNTNIATLISQNILQQLREQLYIEIL